MSGKTDYTDNKIKILSSIITFSYKSPTFFLSDSQNDILMDLLVNHKRLILQCTANIIQKYDENDENVIEEIKPIFPAQPVEEIKEETEEEETKECDIQMDDIRKQIRLSQQKIVQLSSDTFVWHITADSDNNLLSKLKASIANKKNESFHSDVFMLLGQKWYVSMQTHMEENAHTRPRSSRYRGAEKKNLVSFCVHGIMRGSVDAKVAYHLIQTKKKAEVYKTFDHNSHAWRSNSVHSDTSMLSENANAIKQLQEITLKVDIAIIADHSLGEESEEKEESEIDDEVVQWLTSTVGLPGYVTLFKQESIENMSIVKLLNAETLEKMKIKKIGHQLKILHKVDLLKKTDAKTK